MKPIDSARYDAVTFDCYGTLIDWDTGIANQLGPWAVRTQFPATVAELIGRFADHQRKHQAGRPIQAYRAVLRAALADAVADFAGSITSRDLDAFAAGVGSWPAFPDSIDALRQLKQMGKHLGVLSNVDNASFDTTHRQLGGQIDTIVTAEVVGAYKPDRAMFEALFEALAARGIARDRVLHVAQSQFHDVAPGQALGLDVIWIDRRQGRPGRGVTIPSDAEPTARFTNLDRFARALGESNSRGRS
ncbi:MAG: HAD-IA family hydrolase [Pseudomonadota bacterium]